MKDLMLAIRTQLRNITSVKDRDVFLSADKDLIPKTATFPCIGIKDGRVGRADLTGDVTELTLPVEIYVYEKMINGDAEILSVFDVTQAVHDQLQDNEFSGYVKAVDPGDETPVQLLYRDNGLILRKTIFYQYEREES